MKIKNYGGLVESWKLNLIIRRAKSMRFSPDEIEDVLQELFFKVIAFNYEIAKSNGASEKTAFIKMINNHIRTLVRRKIRYQSRLDQLKEESIDSYDPTAINESALDVRSVVESLPDNERNICQALGAGFSINEIANEFALEWHKVKRIVNRVRERFEECGLGSGAC
jgi:RNA polymerase sigma factor (sigma-70 family)